MFQVFNFKLLCFYFVFLQIWNHPDVLYKTYQEQIDLNADLELELDFEISSKSKQSLKQANKSLTDSNTTKLLKRKADAKLVYIIKLSSNYSKY